MRGRVSLVMVAGWRRLFWMTFLAPGLMTPGSALLGLTPTQGWRASSAIVIFQPGHGNSASRANQTRPTLVKLRPLQDRINLPDNLDAATLIFVNIFIRGFSEINDVKMVSKIYCFETF